MKFSTVAPLVLAASSAYASSLTRGYDVIKSRQAKIRRDVLDVCVGLDVDLTLTDILQNGKPLVAGHLDVCLCVSLIPEFVKSNSACQTASGLLGVAKVTAILEGLVNNHPDCQHCSFPEHGHSVCAPDWPCGFECSNGYQPYTNPGDQHPSSCKCPAPMTECNGQCGNYPNGCGSAVPAPPQRRSRHAGIAASKRQDTGPTCGAGYTVCGVVEGSNEYECVDTVNDVESCGGCMVPSPFGTYFPAVGRDCTALPHVESAVCKSSACYITSCAPGYAPNQFNDVCYPLESNPGPQNVTNSKRMFNLGPGVEAITEKATKRADVIAGAQADIRGLVKLGEGAGVVPKPKGL
ncbi:hypothetical protein EIP91_006997 [Steccherinum ochraceum]|uniref:Protein CPL1-like domain-containing protein n=1 Tax=Steccherinum ochraceum TaxID=92696 RepID=A0A4R0RT74_9APHY|nr:hypothetical protein EIP91_006997 [Steccherinum ochraceum]